METYEDNGQDNAGCTLRLKNMPAKMLQLFEVSLQLKTAHLAPHRAAAP